MTLNEAIKARKELRTVHSKHGSGTIEDVHATLLYAWINIDNRLCGWVKLSDLSA